MSGVWSFWGRRTQVEPEESLTAELTDLSKEKSESDTSSSGSTNEQLTSDDKDSSSAYDIIDVDDLPPIDHTGENLIYIVFVIWIPFSPWSRKNKFVFSIFHSSPV